MGHSENKAEGQDASTAEKVETAETKRKVIGGTNCLNKKRNWKESTLFP
jgi:hypothetical protein